MKNGSYFERSYIPDEHKRIVGPIEIDTDKSFMTLSAINIALWVAIVFGVSSFGIAILKGWLG
jgi:hypothetical protein